MEHRWGDGENWPTEMNSESRTDYTGLNSARQVRHFSIPINSEYRNPNSELRRHAGRAVGSRRSRTRCTAFQTRSTGTSARHARCDRPRSGQILL